MVVRSYGKGTERIKAKIKEAFVLELPVRATAGMPGS